MLKTSCKIRQSIKRSLAYILGAMLISFGGFYPAHCQKQKISFKDSTDHRFDLSDWVLTANGFIPIPTIITEPAVGGFGAGLFALFVDPNTPYQDSIEGKLVKTRVKPNIYGVGGAYTVNGTWAVG